MLVGDLLNAINSIKESFHLDNNTKVIITEEKTIHPNFTINAWMHEGAIYIDLSLPPKS